MQSRVAFTNRVVPVLNAHKTDYTGVEAPDTLTKRGERRVRCNEFVGP